MSGLLASLQIEVYKFKLRGLIRQKESLPVGVSHEQVERAIARVLSKLKGIDPAFQDILNTYITRYPTEGG